LVVKKQGIESKFVLTKLLHDMHTPEKYRYSYSFNIAVISLKKRRKNRKSPKPTTVISYAEIVFIARKCPIYKLQFFDRSSYFLSYIFFSVPIFLGPIWSRKKYRPFHNCLRVINEKSKPMCSLSLILYNRLKESRPWAHAG